MFKKINKLLTISNFLSQNKKLKNNSGEEIDYMCTNA